jgi:hypothetical protein
MAVRVTIEFPASPEEYDRVNEAIGSDSPDGLIVHTAADLGGSMKVVDVWESAEKFAAFAESQLGPKVAEALGDSGPTPGEPEIEELHNVEVHQKP